MDALARVFTQEIAEPIRGQVLAAVTTQPLADHTFVRSGMGCIMAVAAFAAINESISEKKLGPDPKRQISIMLQISEEDVAECVKEWDTALSHERDAFIRSLKRHLSEMKISPEQLALPRPESRSEKLVGVATRIGMLLLPLTF